MIAFHNICLEDKGWIEERLSRGNQHGCDYSFANTFIWRNASKIQVANQDGFFVSLGNALNKSYFAYSYPAGDGDLEKVMETLIADARERGIPFCLRAAEKEQVENLKQIFPGRFQEEASRGEWDYIYLVENLTKLSGKRYHGKRNHIARFQDGEDWSYEPISEENMEECLSMNQEWCKRYATGDASKENERCAVHQAAKYFDVLGLEGGILKKGGNVIAYTIGEPLNEDMYVVHFEKAFHEIQGAYPMINQQFVIHNMQGYTYVNREEDMGEEGLRKAKLSYHPDILLEKYNVYLKE